MKIDKFLENPKTFLEKYNTEIAPKFNAIDIFMKTNYKYISIKKTAELLYISENEVVEIINSEKISAIDKSDFFRIMKNGTSSICRLFTRELECGTPNTYYPHEISYIYNIDIDTILIACAKIGKSNFNSCTIKNLFYYIPLQ